MGLLSNSQWNVTKPGARFSAPLQTPLSRMAAIPPEPLSWKQNTSQHNTSTPRAKAGWDSGPTSSGDDLYATGQPRRVHKMCVHLSHGWLFICFKSTFCSLRSAMETTFTSSAHTSTVVDDDGADGVRKPAHMHTIPESKASSVQRETPYPTGSYVSSNKGHLALIKGITLMSTAPETTLPPHLQPWQRKRALTSK